MNFPCPNFEDIIKRNIDHKHKKLYLGYCFFSVNLETINLYLKNYIDFLSHIEEINFNSNYGMKLDPCLTKLKKLSSLEANFIYMKKIPKFIGDITSLIYFSYQNNYVKKIPLSFKNLKNLEELDLKNNNIENISKVFKYLTQLKNLHLGGNQISKFSHHLKNLKNLYCLNLDGNYIKGELPSFLCKMTYLHKLDVSFNEINKEIPKFLALLPNLHYYYNFNIKYNNNNENNDISYDPYNLLRLEKFNMYKSFLKHKDLKLISCSKPRIIKSYFENINLPPEIIYIIINFITVENVLI